MSKISSRINEASATIVVTVNPQPQQQQPTYAPNCRTNATQSSSMRQYDPQFQNLYRNSLPKDHNQRGDIHEVQHTHETKVVTVIAEVILRDSAGKDQLQELEKTFYSNVNKKTNSTTELQHKNLSKINHN